MAKRDLVPVEHVERRILSIRGHNVIIDADLAELYGVETKVLNQAVRRHKERFPADFVVQLTREEKLKVVTDCDHLANLRFSPYLPLAFTEHGAIMAANVLNSTRAIEMSVFVVRAFVRLRGMLTTHKELARKLDELEHKVGEHDEAIRALVTAIRELMSPSSKERRAIGFGAEEDAT